jgi:hypothetical protein
MYKCQICNKVAPAGSRCTLVVAEQTTHEHPFRGYAHKAKREDGKVEYFPDEGGYGPQIKRELKACPNCADIFKAQKEAEKNIAAAKKASVNNSQP